MMMKTVSKQRQRGISFIGLIVVAALIGMAGVVVAQVIPTYLEYQSVLRAVDRAKTGQTVPEIRSLFEKSAMLDDIKSINAKDLDIRKDGDKVVVGFAYEREIHLAGPAYLTLKYEGQSN
jgi:hypothetical protein